MKCLRVIQSDLSILCNKPMIISSCLLRTYKCPTTKKANIAPKRYSRFTLRLQSLVWSGQFSEKGTLTKQLHELAELAALANGPPNVLRRSAPLARESPPKFCVGQSKFACSFPRYALDDIGDHLSEVRLIELGSQSRRSH